MKNLIIFLFLSLSFSITSCSSSDVKKSDVFSEIKIGWIDNNTFRVKAKGFAEDTTDNSEQKKAIAKKNAILNAHNELNNKFISLKSENFNAYEELKSIIKKGIVYKEQYKGNCCYIVYELKERNLKSVIGAK